MSYIYLPYINDMKYCLFLLMLLPVIGNGQIITTVAGNGIAGDVDNCQATAAELNSPADVAIDDSGNIFIADQSNNKIKKVNKSGVITTIAGTGSSGYNGDNIMATSANLYLPIGLALDDSGNIYFTEDGNNRIRKVNPSGIITSIAGDGTGAYNGDNIPSTAAEINSPYGICLDKYGNIFFNDGGNNRIRKINTLGIISTIGGNGIRGYNGDNIAATTAEFKDLGYIRIDTSGNIFVGDHSNYRIRKINTNGIVSTFAGSGILGNNGDGLQATAAELNSPNGVALDNNGNVYIVDDYAQVIRVVNNIGIISTVAGTGTLGYNGDERTAITAQLNNPNSVVTDRLGNVYIADANNQRVRVVTFHAVAVNEINKAANNLQLYPNPAQNELILKSGGDIKSVQVINMLGMVQAFPVPVLNQKEVVLSVGTLPPGMYYVKVNESQMGKFVKE